MQKKRSHPGIRVRHSRTCPELSGGRCRCSPTYEAWVFDRRTGAKIRKSFPTLAAARGWRADATSLMNRGGYKAPTRNTLRDAGDKWIAGAKAEPPTVLNRSGRPYKPSVLRGYESDLKHHVYPELGASRLADLARGDLQALVDRLVGKGLSGSKVRNVLMPVRVVIRHALEHDELVANPTAHLRLPAQGEPRDRAASAGEAAELLDALPDVERGIWATAFYAGLRRGELRALRAGDVDLKAGTITVVRGWDDVVGAIDPKSRASARTVFVLDALRPHIEPLTKRSKDPDGLLFGLRPTTAFEPKNIVRKAKAAWEKANVARAKEELEPLRPIALHEARHSFSTFLDHAGVSEARADRYMGHANASVAARYRHLLPTQIADDRQRVDAYLAGAATGKIVTLAAAG